MAVEESSSLCDEPFSRTDETEDGNPVNDAQRNRIAARTGRPRVAEFGSDAAVLPSPEEIELRKRRASTLLQCPYCEARMLKWAVPQTPFTEWDVPFMYICFNDECPYLLRGWRAMERQGIGGFSYRAMYNPASDAFYPVPIASLKSLREGIIV
jgi:hypothetical protein